MKTNPNFHLFLDDVRAPADVHWVNLPENVVWTVVRTFEEFKRAVTENGLPVFITYDHDLAPEHYNAHMRVVAGMPYEKAFKDVSPTGYTCARWLVDEVLLPAKVPHPKYETHSMNPDGRQAIRSYIDTYRRHLRELSQKHDPVVPAEAGSPPPDASVDVHRLAPAAPVAV